MNPKRFAVLYLICPTSGEHSKNHRLHLPTTRKVGLVQSLTFITLQLTNSVMVVADV